MAQFADARRNPCAEFEADAADPARSFWRLSDKEFDRLITLAREAGTVELKYLVPKRNHQKVCAAVGVDLDAAGARTVYYFDTEDLDLYRHGVVVRARSIASGPDDAVVKLRPLVPDSLPAELRSREDFAIEVDAAPDGYVCSGSLKARLGRDEVGQAVSAGDPIASMLTRAQRELLAERMPACLEADDLIMFGPVDVRRRRVRWAEADSPVTIEQWRYPDGKVILELSTRCKAESAPDVAARIAGALFEHGISLAGPQHTKTRLTLDYFARIRQRTAAED